MKASSTETAKPPKEDVSITITIVETKEGKLTIAAGVPDHAAGTVALELTEQMLHYGRDALNVILGVEKDYEKASVQ